MQASFTVISGPHHGRTFQVPRGKFIIGRETDCHMLLTSNLVSRHHCVLLMDEWTLKIRDLGSKNGTYVNGHKIGTGVMVLLHDDAISIGDMNGLVDLNPATATTKTSDSEALPQVSRAAMETSVDFDGDSAQASHRGAIPPLTAAPPPVPTPLIPVAPSPPSEQVGSARDQEHAHD